MADRLISIDTAQAAGSQLPSAVRAELLSLLPDHLAILLTDNGDGTWTLDLGA